MSKRAESQRVRNANEKGGPEGPPFFKLAGHNSGQLRLVTIYSSRPGLPDNRRC
jgi:hypothetical protein